MARASCHAAGGTRCGRPSGAGTTSTGETHLNASQPVPPLVPRQLAGRTAPRRWRAWLAGACVLAATACDGRLPSARTTLRFWAYGREAEAVETLVRDFERRHPDVRVQVERLPAGSAHEKLLSAFVGQVLPDVAQLSTTWTPELVALGALEPLGARVRTARGLQPADFFPGVWATNVFDGETYALPWYVDTRLLYYRTDLLAKVGYRVPPRTWDEWTQAMRKLKAQGGEGHWPLVLAADDWRHPVTFALQSGATLLRDGGRHADFEQPRFRTAYDFYVGLYRSGLAAPPRSDAAADAVRAFGDGRTAMLVAGSAQIADFRRRLPDSVQSRWMTTPLPGPRAEEAGSSLAGGASLAVLRGTKHAEAAWALVAFLSEPEQQLRLYQLAGDLPARPSAWADPMFTLNPFTHAFAEQLTHLVAPPAVPEWEQIASALVARGDDALRGQGTTDAALAALDADVDRLLEKRRWLLDRETPMKVALR